MKLQRQKYESEISDLKKQVKILHSEIQRTKDTTDEKSMKLYELVLTLEREKQDLYNQNLELLQINAHKTTETSEDVFPADNQGKRHAEPKSIGTQSQSTTE